MRTFLHSRTQSLQEIAKDQQNCVQITDYLLANCFPVHFKWFWISLHSFQADGKALCYSWPFSTCADLCWRDTGTRAHGLGSGVPLPHTSEAPGMFPCTQDEEASVYSSSQQKIQKFLFKETIKYTSEPPWVSFCSLTKWKEWIMWFLNLFPMWYWEVIGFHVNYAM